MTPVRLMAASTGSFRRFERFMMVLVFGSLALVPVVFMVHPPLGQVARDLLVPGLPSGGKLSDGGKKITGTCDYGQLGKGTFTATKA